ncbi:acyltransferase [Dysgonomonas sp. 521]|uniref:acyltransferase family protein n=1 Tax=Dysgonomonas sp. 521 TaxID=2302932 RepID=UPI0013D26A18|nr:acyltransferase [Dysgonomonas sp. 521]NDV95233.1 acyltransferase [Dysgonomonas sp. 521]
MEPKKYQYIDSLRGIAILLVVLVHIGVVLDNTLDYFAIGSFLVSVIFNGAFGVQLFLIASAYTLTMSYYNRLDEPHKNRNFFIRRFFRIAPMYYIAIIYFTLDKYLQFDFVNPDFSAIPLRSMLSDVLFINALIPEYTNNYVPGGWSVSVEFLFYFMLPFICSKVKTMNSALIFFLSTLTLAIIVDPFIRENTIYPYFHEYNFFVQLSVFPLGIIAYFYLNRQEHNIKPVTWVYTAIMMLVFCYIAVPKHIMFSLVFMLLLIIQAKYDFRLFSNRLLAAVGKVSFSMYLIHFAVIYLFNRFGFSHVIPVSDFGTSLLNFVLMYIIVTIAAFIISSFTYRAIEVPGQNLGRKLIKKLN